MDNKKRYLVIVICGVIGLIIGSTLAWYTWTSTNTDVTFTIGGVNITYEAGDDITGVGLRPVSTKEVGVENNYAIKKDITVSSSKTTYFSLYLNAEVFGTGLQAKSLKWELYDGTNKLSEGNFGGVAQGDTITVLSDLEINTTTRSLSLYIWIDGNMSNPESMQNQEYKFVLNADATDKGLWGDESNANTPALIEGMVPVVYNGSTWEVADQSQWYNYEKQIWANAVLVNDESLRTATAGTPVPEDSVLAYYVWIPRFEYDYVNIENYAGGTQEQPGEIKVNFVEANDTTASTNYKIHPAFTFGTTELSGFWVGKFETTGSASEPTIKPNLSSLTDMSVSEQFTAAQLFSASGNSYGMSTSADAHMMKNSEWGAVAYLSQSKYGKYGNSSYTGASKEVYFNNTNTYTTGCSAGNPYSVKTSTCAYTYEKSTGGTGASTTGTIYGVYDMSGGAYEYVMGVYNGTIGSSGFSSLPLEKYYDKYTTESATTACSGGICYGHALSETSGWYRDQVIFESSTSWFYRGSGVFYIALNGVGNRRPDRSFRVVVLDL